MTKLQETNFATARAYVLAAHGQCITGPDDAFFTVLCDSSLTPGPCDALEKTASSLGWEAGATFVSIDSGKGLDAPGVFEVIEGLDPICLVIAGSAPTQLAAQAYHCELPKQASLRLFGRATCIFEDLGALLATDAGKRKAWEILKTLPGAK